MESREGGCRLSDAYFNAVLVYLCIDIVNIRNILKGNELYFQLKLKDGLKIIVS